MTAGARTTAATLVLVGVLLAAVVLSLTIGAQPVSPRAAWHGLFGGGAGMDDAIARARGVRTLLGIVVGGCVGLGGAAMQGLTRNPLADPGILGVNSGAALAVVGGLVFLDIGSQLGFVLLALAGGLLAAAVVYAVASLGPGGGQPVTMALAGAGVTAGASSLIAGALVGSRSALDVYRFWQVGSVAGRDVTIIPTTLPFLLIGLVLVLPSGSILNALALGDDVARGLGQRVLLARAAVAFGAVLLCAVATSLAGPIAFVGLVVPHLVRLLVGIDQRRILLGSLLGGPVLLLLADTLGRVVAPPSEVSAGIMTAVLGAPALVLLIRRAGLAR